MRNKASYIFEAERLEKKQLDYIESFKRGLVHASPRHFVQNLRNWGEDAYDCRQLAKERS